MEWRLSPGNPKEALVRILGPSGAPMGTGCYTLNGLIVTCAHVVRDALGVKKEEQERLRGALPKGQIRLDFPFLPTQRDAAGGDAHPSFQAEVVAGGWGWMDAISYETDIAVLRLISEAPFEHGRLFATADSPNQDIDVFAHGFPSLDPYGWMVDGTLKAHGDQPGGLRVLSYKDSTYLFNPGFSGAPVFFNHGAEAAGLLIGAPHYDKEAQRGRNEVALVIPANRVMALLNAMPRSDAVPRSVQALVRAEAYVPLLRERVRQARPLGNDTRLCDGLAFALERIDRAIRSGLTADAIDGFARTVAHLERFRGEAAACGLEDRLTVLQFAEVRAALDGLRRKYPGMEAQDAARASVGNDLQDDLAHRDERLTLLQAIEERLQAVRDETLRMPENLRAQACAALEDLWLELHQNPLRLDVLDGVRAEIEALDRSLLHPVIAHCQTLMGVYAERLPDLAIFRDFTEGPEMIVIPAGRFLMGSPKDEPERDNDEGPRHEVTIPMRFAIGRYAVTFEEWDFAVAAGGCGGYLPDDEGWGRGRRPAINVSWNDAQAYVAWLSTLTRKTYRLPSEAEWEYCCRADTDTPFWWGAAINPDQANYNGNYDYDGGPKRGGQEGGLHRKQTLPVDSFMANPWGLFQVHGNVWEWVEDRWHESYADKPEELKTTGGVWVTKGGRPNVLRGGTWNGRPCWLRSAVRVEDDSGGWPDNVSGFRLARTL